jgi:uncharacterized protein (TIGR03435 family)
MMTLTTVAMALFAWCGLLMQSAASASDTPTFEVASIKLSSAQERNIGMSTFPGGRVTITNYTLRMLIHEAYSVQDFEISGGSGWADNERYSIVAKPPASSESSKIHPTNPKLPPPQEERLMLRTLLADRFQLKIHWETKDGPVLALIVGNKGPKLKEPKDKDAFPVVVYGRTGKTDLPDYLEGQNASMTLLAARMAGFLRRPVLDQTGLKGSFDFHFAYSGDDSQSDTGPSLIGGVEEIGLKLVATKGPVARLVIDHAEKPSEN